MPLVLLLVLLVPQVSPDSAPPGTGTWRATAETGIGRQGHWPRRASAVARSGRMHPVRALVHGAPCRIEKGAAMADTAPGRLVVSRATLDDWRVVTGWAADEGWNPGLGDAPSFFAQDPEGFFVGRLGDEPVSAVSVVNYGQDYAFLRLLPRPPRPARPRLRPRTWRRAWSTPRAARWAWTASPPSRTTTAARASPGSTARCVHRRPLGGGGARPACTPRRGGGPAGAPGVRRAVPARRPATLPGVLARRPPATVPSPASSTAPERGTASCGRAGTPCASGRSSRTRAPTPRRCWMR